MKPEKILIIGLIVASVVVVAIVLFNQNQSKVFVPTATPEMPNFHGLADHPLAEKKAAGLAINGPYLLDKTSTILPHFSVTVTGREVTVMCAGQKFGISVTDDHQAKIVFPTLLGVTTTKAFPVYELGTAGCLFSVGVGANDIPEVYIYSGP